MMYYGLEDGTSVGLVFVLVSIIKIFLENIVNISPVMVVDYIE